MAEYGLIEGASQQCAAVTGALNALGGKLPGGLLLARIQANELQNRLTKHAEVNLVFLRLRSFPEREKKKHVFELAG
jgi:hypothetical protein